MPIRTLVLEETEYYLNHEKLLCACVSIYENPELSYRDTFHYSLSLSFSLSLSPAQSLSLSLSLSLYLSVSLALFLSACVLPVLRRHLSHACGTFFLLPSSMHANVALKKKSNKVGTEIGFQSATQYNVSNPPYVSFLTAKVGSKYHFSTSCC
jgi:hypothetical protein